jgi:D-alanine-D-alanine ligase
MNRNKIRLGVLFGGKSAEHEISLQSARNIIDAVDKERYEAVLIGIDKEGVWHPLEEMNSLSGELLTGVPTGQEMGKLALVPGDRVWPFVKLPPDREIGPIDVVFPVLHGPHGEDGTVQGLLKLLDIPFVGAGVLGSAVGMDKDVMKRLLRDAGIPIADFLVFDRFSPEEIRFRDIVDRLGLPLFIKPANLGSSVGISKVSEEEEFFRGLEEAFSFDRKVVIEEAVRGREIECAVLGNESPMASLPGEVVTDLSRHPFYSYKAKYLDENGALLVIPAKLDDEITQRIQGLAVKTFQVLCCEGMGRVDFFLTEDRRVIVNEINTIPGFTKISMYPKLWEASGISYRQLIDRLIQLALDRHEKEKRLKSSVQS